MKIVCFDGHGDDSDDQVSLEWVEKLTNAWLMRANWLVGGQAVSVTHRIDMVETACVEDVALQAQNQEADAHLNDGDAAFEESVDSAIGALRCRWRPLMSGTIQRYWTLEDGYQRGQIDMTAYIRELVLFGDDVTPRVIPSSRLRRFAEGNEAAEQESVEWIEEEVRTFSAEVARALCVTDVDRDAVEVVKLFEFAKAACARALSAGEARRCATSDASLFGERLENCISRLESCGAVYGLAGAKTSALCGRTLDEIRDRWKYAVTYYESALARSDTIATRTAELVSRRRARVVALICTGFHTEHVAQALWRTHGMEIVVFTPNTGVIDNERYKRRLRWLRDPNTWSAGGLMWVSEWSKNREVQRRTKCHAQTQKYIALQAQEIAKANARCVLVIGSRNSWEQWVGVWRHLPDTHVVLLHRYGARGFPRNMDSYIKAMESEGATHRISELAASIVDLPFQDGVFDYVVTDLFGYMRSAWRRQRFVDEATRVTKIGGRVALLGPTKAARLRAATPGRKWGDRLARRLWWVHVRKGL